MALLGSAALAMWWNVSAPDRPELEHWHAHEHFPERLGLPGFRRASRWTAADGSDGFFVLYELADYGVLSSPAYVARLNAPSAWSTRMMPLHRQMVRCQCRVIASAGAFTARHALTIRGSAVQDLGPLAADIVQRPGIVGLHVLRHEPPALAPTTEQRIRGHADRAADWIVVACGYDAAALRALHAAELGAAMPGGEAQLVSLAYSATPPDVL